MNKNVILGTVAGGVVSFFLAWLIFGMLLMNFYTQGSTHYDGLMKDPPVMWAMAVGSIAWASVLALAFDMGQVRDIAKGSMAGALLALGMSVWMDAGYYGFMNLYSARVLAVDIAANGVFGAVIGAFMGWFYGWLAGRKA